jgi:hypothetical protein
VWASKGPTWTSETLYQGTLCAQRATSLGTRRAFERGQNGRLPNSVSTLFRVRLPAK